MDPRVLDEISINATASAVMQLLDGWLLRASPDLPFRRSNCAIALVDAPAGSIDEVEAFFARRNLPVIVQVRDTMTALDERLALRGYAIETATDLLIAPASTVRDRCGEPAWPVLLHDELDDVSIDAYGAVMGTTEYAADRITAYGRMMRSLGPVAFAATVSEHDVPIGVGFGVVERGWIGYYGIATSEHARRRGVSTAIMRALTERAIAEGATNAYLQVDAENNGAQTMYARQGFTRSYGYHYRTKQ